MRILSLVVLFAALILGRTIPLQGACPDVAGAAAEMAPERPLLNSNFWPGLAAEDLAVINRMGSLLMAEGLSGKASRAFAEQIAVEARAGRIELKDFEEFRESLTRLNVKTATAGDIETVRAMLVKYNSQFLFAFHMTFADKLTKILAGDASSQGLPYLRPGSKLAGAHGIFVASEPIGTAKGFGAKLVGNHLVSADATIVFQGEAARAFKGYGTADLVESFFTLNLATWGRMASSSKIITFRRVIIKKYRLLEDQKTVVVEDVELQPVGWRATVRGWTSLLMERANGFFVYGGGLIALFGN